MVANMHNDLMVMHITSHAFIERLLLERDSNVLYGLSRRFGSHYARTSPAKLGPHYRTKLLGFSAYSLVLGQLSCTYHAASLSLLHATKTKKRADY